MRHRITRISGDGIGPEVMGATCRVLEAAGAEIDWEDVPAGEAALEAHQTPLPDSTLDSIRKNKVALKAPLNTPIGKGFSSVNVAIRKALNLYACLRPVQSLAGIQCLYPDLDLIIFRENTEGLYSGIEHEVVPGVMESLKIVSRTASIRIAKFAFEYAKKHKRKKVTIVHKANIMKKSDGLFLACGREVAENFPEVECNDLIVDNTAMQLVRWPQQFDILLLGNLYGDILSDLAAGLVGGLGISPGANIGDDSAVFEAVHGTAPDIAGQNKANPTALLRSAIMMMEHVGEEAVAKKADAALRKVLKGDVKTGDLGGKASTTEFTDAICSTVT